MGNKISTGKGLFNPIAPDVSCGLWMSIIHFIEISKSEKKEHKNSIRPIFYSAPLRARYPGNPGKVDEFVGNPENGLITHLVMSEGHLWGKKEVIIPLSALGDSRENTLFLKLDKQQIEALLTLRVRIDRLIYIP